MNRLPYLPVDGRPLRLTLGLRPLDEATWLDVDADYEADLAQKERLLHDCPDEVVAHLPAGEAGSLETLRLVLQWLARHRPDVAGAAQPVPGLHPIDAAGRLVQEDLCVLTRADQAWLLTAASVCFPSRWRLRDKLGRSVEEIHGPVPGWAVISSVVDRAMDRLTVQRPQWRLNWTILPSPALFQPPGGPDRAVHDLADLWVRVERQTLRRLPETDAVLFTIRTYRRRLDAVVADPDAAHALAATLRTVEPDQVAYKGWQRLLPLLLERLDAADTVGTTRGSAARLPAGRVED